VLDKGYLIATGTLEEIRNSTLPRVRQFLDRVPDVDSEPAEEYLDSLLKDD
jgi:hypothetical protein